MPNLRLYCPFCKNPTLKKYGEEVTYFQCQTCKRCCDMETLIQKELKDAWNE